jgi:hypothetical protein
MIKLELIVKGIDETISALRRISERSFLAEQLERTIPTLKSLQKDRFERISRSTPYSPSYLGRFKPSGRYRAGASNDPGYAKDTLALYSDLTQNIQLDNGSTVSIWSDLHYAEYQETLLNQNHNLSFFYDDMIYGDVVESAIASGIDEAWKGP